MKFALRLVMQILFWIACNMFLRLSGAFIFIVSSCQSSFFLWHMLAHCRESSNLFGQTLASKSRSERKELILDALSAIKV